MPDAYTPNKLGLIEPAAGSYSGTWDQPLFANWQTIDAALGGTTTITLSSSNVTLTVPTFPTSANPPSVATSAQNLRIYLTGTLTANVTVNLPVSVGGFWIIDDATTGNFTVTIKTTAVGSVGVSSVQGRTLTIVSDGTNVKLADSGNTINPELLVPTGTILSSARTTAPAGYLICNGSAVSRTTYANLFAAIGVSWGQGDGSTTFNIPNMVGMFARGIGGSGPASVGQYQADAVGPLTISDPGHVHVYGINAGSSPGSTTAGYQGTGSLTVNPQTASAVTGIQITNTTTETRPKNMGVLYIIKT